jgi:hypothetical protein
MLAHVFPTTAEAVITMSLAKRYFSYSTKLYAIAFACIAGQE